ncbi:MAG: hypothetical protein ACRYF3_09835 [Janthinobacterium lividum]
MPARAGGQARRVAAPSWRDPRLLVGLVLVLGSVALGARTVTAAQSTTGVYALASAVGAGSALTVADLRVVQVHLDDTTTGAYVLARGGLEPNWVVLRGMPAGELLPRSAIGHASDLTARPVTVHLEGATPDGVGVGSLVDVWVSWPGAQPGVTQRPELLVEAAEVSAVQTGSAGLSARTGGDVSVLVPQGVLPDVLQAVTGDAGIALVPLPGSGSTP